jgi:thiamine kinase-like enzyme
MFLKRIFGLVLFLGWLQTGAFCQSDEEAIRQVFEQSTGRTDFSLQVSRIQGGLTNKNFKVIFDQIPLFVRLGHPDPESLRIDRRLEQKVYAIVEREGIAPTLIYSDASSGNLVVPFISGTPYGKMNGAWFYDRDASIQSIAALLHRVHAHESEDPPSVEYPFRIIEEYIQQAHAAEIPVPADIERAVEVAATLKRLVPPHKSVLCHHDLVPDNFIYDGETLYLVDWEYADWGDELYDLAAVCVEHKYTQEEKELLLREYCQVVTDTDRVHLEVMCMLYSLRDALWYILENQHPKNTPCDFLELANYHYQNFAASERWLREHTQS